jgi:hypothetical protein
MQKSIDILSRLEPENKRENHSQPSKRRTLRSQRNGRPVPCDRCAEVRVWQGRCIGCGAERVATPQGLEAIGSILSRLEIGGEA